MKSNRGGMREGDRWLDEIKFGDGMGNDFAPESESMYFYGRRIPAVVVAIAIASKTSPETIMKVAEKIEPIKRRLLKE